MNTLAFQVLPFGSCIGELGAMIVPVVAIIAPFLFVVTVLVIMFLKEYRTRKLQQEIIRQLIDKGQPIPPELLHYTPHKKERNDRRSGLILIAVGVALYFFFGGNTFGGAESGMHWIGLIPGLIGVAMLINWVLDRGSKGGEDGKQDK
jgi:hypothetical protein